MVWTESLIIVVNTVCSLVIWASEGVLEAWQLAGIFLNEWGNFPVHLWRIWFDITALGHPSAACNWYKQENHYYCVETSHESGMRQTGVPIRSWQWESFVYCCNPSLPRVSESPLLTHIIPNIKRMCGMNWETQTPQGCSFTVPCLLFMPFPFSLWRPFVMQVGWFYFDADISLWVIIAICKSWPKKGNWGMQNIPYAYKSQNE